MMGKYKKYVQIGIFSVVLIIAGYTVVDSVFGGEERPPEAGDPVPDFVLETLGGETMSPDDFENRPVVINFWGTFCPPCVEETPALQRMYDKYKDQGAVILGVNLGEQPVVRIEQFVQRFDVTYPILLDPELLVRDQFGVRSYPTTFFVGRDGMVKEVFVGGMTEGFIESRIVRLLEP